MGSQIGWTLLIVGVALAALGGLLLFGPSIPWLGRLPGDIRVERENVRFYFPLTTCLVVSLVLSLVIWFVRALMR